MTIQELEDALERAKWHRKMASYIDNFSRMQAEKEQWSEEIKRLERDIAAARAAS